MNARNSLATLLAVLAALAVLILPLQSPARAADIDEIIDTMDRLYRSRTSRSDVEMLIVTPHWERSIRMQVYSEGLQKTFVRIEKPLKDSGIATLRSGTEMWNYFPRINKVMKVPPSMMMSAWMGSDFTNDDLVKESTLREDYEARLMEPPGGAPPGHIYIELMPREDSPVVWGRIVLMVRASDYLPVLEEYYDERGDRMRRMEFKDIGDLGGRRLPRVMILTPLAPGKEGNRTEVRYISSEFDAALPEDTFTLRNLQRR